MTIRLNDLQLVLLSHAAASDNGSLVPLPESCAHDSDRIGKAVASLLRRKLVEERPVTDRSLCWRGQDQDIIGLFITDAGRAAIGGDDNTTDESSETETEAETEATANGTEARPDQDVLAEHEEDASSPSPRPGGKIGAVVALLQREQGATLEEMVAATGWLPHTTRAALTGLRKKGHVIARTKREDATCYRIAAEG